MDGHLNLTNVDDETLVDLHQQITELKSAVDGLPRDAGGGNLLGALAQAHAESLGEVRIRPDIDEFDES